MSRLIKPEWGRFTLLLTIAAALTIIPLPESLRPYRPHWMLLALFYLGTYLPAQTGIIRSWLLGILIDAISGSLLGIHAITYAFTSYITLQFHLRLRLYAMVQQMLVITLLLCVNLTIEFLIRSATEGMPDTTLFWAPILTTPLLWPLFFIHKGGRPQSPHSR